MIEELLNKPYWIVDILPEQAPPERGRQYRRFEDYWLQEPRRSTLRRRFADIADLVAVRPKLAAPDRTAVRHCHDLCIVKSNHFENPFCNFQRISVPACRSASCMDSTAI